MKNIMVVVADLAFLKAYQLQHTSQNTPRLELVEEFSTPGESLDKFTQMAGRYRSPTVSGKWTTPWGERNTLELEQRKRSIRQLAEHVEKLVSPREVDGCYLAASREINNQMVDALPPKCRTKILKNVHADLTKLEKEDLIHRFEGNGGEGAK